MVGLNRGLVLVEESLREDEVPTLGIGKLQNRHELRATAVDGRKLVELSFVTVSSRQYGQMGPVRLCAMPARFEIGPYVS